MHAVLADIHNTWTGASWQRLGRFTNVNSVSLSAFIRNSCDTYSSPLKTEQHVLTLAREICYETIFFLLLFPHTVCSLLYTPHPCITYIFTCFFSGLVLVIALCVKNSFTHKFSRPVSMHIFKLKLWSGGPILEFLLTKLTDWVSIHKCEMWQLWNSWLSILNV